MGDDVMRLGVLISGSGTNLQAIIDAVAQGELSMKIAVVISNKEHARGLDRARDAGIPAVWIDPTAFGGGTHVYNDAILEALTRHEVDAVAMAGYMRLLGSQILEAYPGRVLNIHPSLLPAFPGASGIKDAFDYGVKRTGVTVHLASEKFDEGPIIAQECVEIADEDTLETLEAKIHEVEHRLYPRALQLLAQGRLLVVGRKVFVR